MENLNDYFEWIMEKQLFVRVSSFTQNFAHFLFFAEGCGKFNLSDKKWAGKKCRDNLVYLLCLDNPILLFFVGPCLEIKPGGFKAHSRLLRFDKSLFSSGEPRYKKSIYIFQFGYWSSQKISNDILWSTKSKGNIWISFFSPESSFF